MPTKPIKVRRSVRRAHRRKRGKLPARAKNGRFKKRTRRRRKTTTPRAAQIKLF